MPETIHVRGIRVRLSVSFYTESFIITALWKVINFKSPRTHRAILQQTVAKFLRNKKRARYAYASAGRTYLIRILGTTIFRC